MSSHKKVRTELRKGIVRIGESGCIEEFVMTIQHQQTENRSVGIYEDWKPVLIDGSKIKIRENGQALDIPTFLLPPEPYLFSGEYFTEEGGVLCSYMTSQSANMYHEPVFVLLAGKTLCVEEVYSSK